MAPTLVSPAAAPSIEAQIAYQEAVLARHRALAPVLIRSGTVSDEASEAEEAVVEAILATLCAAGVAPSRVAPIDGVRRLEQAVQAMDQVVDRLVAQSEGRRHG